MVAWSEPRPTRGRVTSPWWFQAVLLAAHGPLVIEYLGVDEGASGLLERASPPPWGGVWVWEGRPRRAAGDASALDLGSGRWRQPTRCEWREARDPEPWVELTEAVRLRPAPSCELRSRDALVAALERDPAQCPRPGAVGDVLELTLAHSPGGPAASLTGYHVASGAFALTIVADDGEIDVALGLWGWEVEAVRPTEPARADVR